MLRFVFTIVAINAFQFLAAQSNIDVLHYKFEMELSDQTETIKGKASITVQFTETTNQFWINLTSPNRTGKGMTVDKVTESSEQPAFSQRNDTLVIQPVHEIEKGETRTFEISYKGIPGDGLIISKNRYGERTFFADNWPNRAHNWIPCKDEPDDKATFEFLVTAPAEYKVIANGRLQEEKMLSADLKFTHWVEDVSLPTKVMVIGVARFAVRQFADGPPGIPVSAWTYPQDTVPGFKNYSDAPSIVKFYSDYIGPYPYNKLANVQSKTIFGGMENASCIFYYEQSAEEKRSIEDIVAHEIAHQWFGDMASEKSFPHLWLSEGFATYMTDIYLGSKYGVDSMNRRLMDERKTVINFIEHSNKPVVDSVSPLMDLLNANSYQKGAWILHMLHKQMGDTVFKKFIREYYDRFKGKNADTNDLEKIAEEISQKDLHSFFQQWLYTPGIPQLNVQWKYDPNSQKITVKVTQMQNQGTFEFPLDLSIETRTTKEIVATIKISRAIETFTIGVADPDVRLTLDPLTNLLFDGHIEKISP